MTQGHDDGESPSGVLLNLGSTSLHKQTVQTAHYSPLPMFVFPIDSSFHVVLPKRFQPEAGLLRSPVGRLLRICLGVTPLFVGNVLFFGGTPFFCGETRRSNPPPLFCVRPTPPPKPELGRLLHVPLPPKALGRRTSRPRPGRRARPALADANGPAPNPKREAQGVSGIFWSFFVGGGRVGTF